MSFSITISSAILSLGWVSCLWHINELSSSWFQKLHNRSEPFDFLDVLGALLSNCLELIIGKVLRRVQCFLSEVLFHISVGSIVRSFLLFLGDLRCALLALKLVLLVTSGRRFIRGSLGGIVTALSVFITASLRCSFGFFGLFGCRGIHQLSQLEQIILNDHVRDVSVCDGILESTWWALLGECSEVA